MSFLGTLTLPPGRHLHGKRVHGARTRLPCHAPWTHIYTRRAHTLCHTPDVPVPPGATFVTGEYRREGNLIWPVLLDHVTPAMRIAWEEPFGPVLPVMRVPDAAAAVAHCNALKYGLQGCVFTRDVNAAIAISDAMETGTVQVGQGGERGAARDWGQDMA